MIPVARPREGDDSNGDPGEREGLPAGFRISPVTEDDVRALNRLVNDPEVARFLDLAPPVPLDRTLDFLRYIREQEGAWWALRVDGAVAGSVGLIPADPSSRLGHTASLFVYLDSAWWGRGLAGRGIRAMVDEAARRGLVRLEVLVVAGNQRSLHLFAGCGFEQEGVRRAGFRTDDGYLDLVQLARILR
ncbi:MAG: GNAT family N-acetyltransferase [Methanospirillum sp.]|nr:GNAT family N-acetyltransferase [Methanospirillum sp.]